MYEDFFKLSGRPFQLNPDPRFFFRSKAHKRAQAYMRYGLQQEQGFIVVTGDVGTGKTMLVNNLFDELETEKMVAAKIVSTNVKDVDLLRLIAAEFELPFERSAKASLLHKLESFFKSCRREGKRALLVIDEAQNLPRSALEELRMLSNFDYEGFPLVQSFLLGQREFRAILRAPGLEQLRQRVIAAYHLKPLTAPEVQSYIEHRMKKVDWTDDPVIQHSAYEAVFDATGGVPRRINTLFDRVLLSCSLDEVHEISASTVNAVRDEIYEEQYDDRPASVSSPEPLADSEAVSPEQLKTEASDDARKIERLERRIRDMQATIDSLTSKLDDNKAPIRNPERTGLFDYEVPRFPVWTTMFASIMGFAVLAGAAIGYWLMKN